MRPSAAAPGQGRTIHWWLGRTPAGERLATAQAGSGKAQRVPSSPSEEGGEDHGGGAQPFRALVAETQFGTQ
eukprot:15466513-Alexandrium_andersonii.AAC.1